MYDKKEDEEERINTEGTEEERGVRGEEDEVEILMGRVIISATWALPS
jgi:hypothetical protein